jgi:hypothetical protein
MALEGDHPLLARGQRNLAVLLLATSRKDEGLACAQAALDIHEKTRGKDHARRIESALTLADALDALDRSEVRAHGARQIK